MIRDEFINHEFFWFIGAVEDIDDTELFARVKVRPYGYYETEANGGPTKDELPWATVLLPNTSASKAGVGSTHALLVGSWVVGFFRDGRSAQDPIIIGSIPTQTDGKQDVPTDDLKKKTHVTEAGHTVIFDDTPGNIQIVHQAGSSITMDKDGGITIVSKPGQKTKIV